MFLADSVLRRIVNFYLSRDFRVKAIAREIFRTYASNSHPEPLVLVCVLKSSFKFFCALQEEIEQINSDSPNHVQHPQTNNGGSVVNGNGTSHSQNGLSLPLLCEFIRVKSYVNTTSDTSSEVQIQGIIDPEGSFANKVRNHVIFGNLFQSASL